MLEKIKPNLVEQSPMQFRFTAGLSPTIAVLLITEASLNARCTNEILYIASLDTHKAFDVVNHDILQEKLYERDPSRNMEYCLRYVSRIIIES